MADFKKQIMEDIVVFNAGEFTEFGFDNIVQKQPSSHMTSPLKAVPLAVLLAMSPVTETAARDIMSQEECFCLW